MFTFAFYLNSIIIILNRFKQFKNDPVLRNRDMYVSKETLIKIKTFF